MPGYEKTPEEIEAEQKLQDMINTTAPKGLVSGVTSGVGNILAGAVGAVGVVVLAPTLGLAMGAKNAGIVGGFFGLIGGALIGVVGGALVGVGGTLRVCVYTVYTQTHRHIESLL